MKIYCLFLCCVIAGSSSAHGKYTDSGSLYKDWYRCIIIAKHDTLSGHVKPKYEYFGKGSFTVVFDNGRKRRLKPSDIAELWILNPRDTIKYRAINIEGEYRTTLYRVIVDGECELLYLEGVRAVNLLSQNFMSPLSIAYSKLYTIYYKGDIWEINVSPGDFFMDPQTDLRKLARQVFKECTQLAYRIETGQYTTQDFRLVVKEFNECKEGKETKN